MFNLSDSLILLSLQQGVKVNTAKYLRGELTFTLDTLVYGTYKGALQKVAPRVWHISAQSLPRDIIPFLPLFGPF